MLNAIENTPESIELPVEIAEAANVFKRVISGNRYVPILDNVLIESDGSMLSLRATDLEVQARYMVPCVAPLFRVTIPVKGFAEAIKGAKKVSLTILSDTRVALKVNGITREFETLPSEDFPILQVFGADEKVTHLSGKFSEWLAALAMVRTFAADEPAHGSVLMGTELWINKDGAASTLTATDGHRLGHVRLSMGQDGEARVILPEGLSRVLSAVKAPKGPCAVYCDIGERIARIAGGNWAFYARLVDGQYPHWPMVIPQGTDEDAIVTLCRKELLEVIKGAAKVAAIGKRHGSALITIETAHGGFKMRVTSESDDGRFDAMVTAETLRDFPSAHFNGHLLAETIAALTSERITLRSSGPLSPLMIFEGEEVTRGATPWAVIMPLRK